MSQAVAGVVRRICPDGTDADSDTDILAEIEHEPQITRKTQRTFSIPYDALQARLGELDGLVPFDR